MSKEFIELVSKMREAQRGYFKTSHGSHEKQEYLKESKRLESAVDKWIKEYKEPGLFSQRIGDITMVDVSAKFYQAPAMTCCCNPFGNCVNDCCPEHGGMGPCQNKNCGNFSIDEES